MSVFVTIVHIVACVVLILVVLLQAGKGANMGAAFGGSSQTIFGSGGAGTFLGKVTTVIAAIFMITSLTLSYFSLTRASSIMGDFSRPATKAAPQPQAAPQKPAPVDTGKTGETTIPAAPPGAGK